MALKELEYLSNTRIRIDTGHKTFDRQCDYLDTGNVSGDVQFSWYIRPISETSCNGLSFAPGRLFEFDITTFKELPSSTRDWIRNLNREIILYEFRHFRRAEGKERKFIHGYVVTEPYPSHKLIATIPMSSRKASKSILETVLPYIARK
jgi:hypothetical protein